MQHTRRDFLAQGMAGASLIGAGITGHLTRVAEAKESDVGYIRDQIPEFRLPPFDGERYAVRVPDTLELQTRAALAAHALTETTDPLADFEPYYKVLFRTDPPLMYHNWWHASTGAKFVLALPLMRIVSGNEENLAVDRCWMEVALKSQGPDGLMYTPDQGRPWSFGLPTSF